MKLKEVIISLHGIEEILQDPPQETFLYQDKTNPRIQKIVELARQKNVVVKECSTSELDDIASERKHQGLVLVLFLEKKLGKVAFDRFLSDLVNPRALVIFLDGVTDPQNYGAILRSADQFCVSLVVIPSARSVSATPAVFAASSGAAAWVSYAVVPNLSRAIEQLKKKNFWIYGTIVEGGHDLDKLDLRGRVAFVMGSEGKGLSRLVQERCDHLVSIPTAGKLDSLNVSVATGIVLYEVRRQQWS